MNRGIRIVFRAIPLAMGTVCRALGLYVMRGGSGANHFVARQVLVRPGAETPDHVAGDVLTEIAAICSSPIPLIPVTTCLACLFFASLLFEAVVTDPGIAVPARPLVGLGAVCFTLLPIVSILQAGRSGKG